jgi:FKBP-type peptidyl-prolyl cis-trans isomerase
MTIGTGARAAAGTIATIQYRGILTRGDRFRSSYDEGQPLRVHPGRGEVITGLDRGILDMWVGGWRRMVISSHVAYGVRGVPGVVPRNAVLIFEVELLDIQAHTTLRPTHSLPSPGCTTSRLSPMVKRFTPSDDYQGRR